MQSQAALTLARRESSTRPNPTQRLKARELLLEGSGPKLQRLCDADPVAGVLWGQSQACGRLMSTLAESGLVPEQFHAEADRLECIAWNAMMQRVYLLAGESLPEKPSGTLVR